MLRVLVALALVLLVAIWSPSYYVTVLAALALPVVAWEYALASVVFVAVTAREAPSGRGFDYVTMLGSQVYYQGKIPVITFLAFSAIVVAFIRLRRRGERLVMQRTAWWLLGCLAALAVLAFTLGIVNGQSVFSAVNQNSRNFVTVALGVTMGLLVIALPNEIKAVKTATVVGLGLLVVAAIYAVATGQAADARVSRYFTYYDSALPAVAASVFGALLIGRSRLDWPSRVAMGLALTLIVTGFRLTIWGSAFAVLVLAILLSRVWANSARRIAVSVIILLAFVLVLPGMRTDITTRVGGASSAATAVIDPSVAASTSPPATSTIKTTPTVPSSQKEPSTPSSQKEPSTPSSQKEPSTPSSQKEPSTSPGSGKKPSTPAAPRGYGVAAESSQGHLEDIRIAWTYVRTNFWTGIGPQHPQLPGLASDNTKVLYVHNEWLQDWLRFGLGSVVILTVFVVLVALLAVRALYDRKSSAIQRGAAILGLIMPICFLDFPYLSKSNQWPLLIGIAAGLLVFPHSRTQDSTADGAAERDAVAMAKVRATPE